MPHSLRDDSLELALMRIFSAGVELDAALTNSVNYIAASDDWDAAVVWLIDGSGTLAARAIWLDESLPLAGEMRARFLELRCPRGHGLPGRAWAANDVIWVPDLLDESTLARGVLAANAGLHTVVAVPMMDSHQTVGVMEVYHRSVRPISAPRRESLVRAAAALAHLLERRRAEDERRRLIELVERKGKEWLLTFDAMRQPIFLTDREGRIIRLNRAARDLAGGASYADLIGKEIGSVAALEPWQTLQDLVTAVAESGQPCTAHVEEVQAVFDVDASLDAEGQRIVVVLRDTTDLVRLQESVRRGEQLAALGELVAGVAHQVKNPLFGMSVTVDLLQERVLPNADTPELFDALRKWLHRLDRLMESLLAYGKTWTFDFKAGYVKEVLEQALDVCRPAATANGVRLDFQAAGDAVLLMDPHRLVHAFENLITNAVQHSPAGGVVEVFLAVEDQAVEVAVADHGPGFRPDDRSRIFEPFFTRRRGGTGLGLSIVQRVVDEHGGTVTAESPSTGGAFVRVRIPRYDERTTSASRTAHSDR